MSAQSEKLRKTGKNLKRIQNSAVPGLDKLMGLIKKAETKNTIIIALVISLCLVFMIYFHGFKHVV